jgi:6,7-dimethyl-8-ribityllumazine synthase
MRIFMQQANQGQPSPTLLQRWQGDDLKIGLVQSRFNAHLTDAMAQYCKEALVSLGVPNKRIRVVQVPGALEIALALQGMAETEEYDALVAVGCVIRGETYHFELVCNESAAGITRVSLDYQIPIANAILTVENEAQALARVKDKAEDGARVTVEMANLLLEL